MKTQKSLFIIFLLCFNYSFSQVFISENGDFIDLNKNEAKLFIKDCSYSGNFQNFTSKKDKKEYLIYSYFSRTILILLDKPLDEYGKDTPDLNMKVIKLIHSNMTDSIIKTINKQGIDSLKNFMVIYESSEKEEKHMSNTQIHHIPI